MNDEIRTCRYCARKARKSEMLRYSKHHIHPRCALLKWDYWVAIMLPVDQVKRIPLLSGFESKTPDSLKG
jgi:hypothetical protein